MFIHGALGSIAAAIFFTAVEAASGNGISTRFWDCCKPSCAWPGKASVNQPPRICNAQDQYISDANTVSGCTGGTAYTCTNQSPWAVNDLVSYGFAATAISGGTEASTCCACYAVTFTTSKAKGKVMLVQSINTGSDLSSNHFDLQIPGGGVGYYSGGCTAEFGSFPGAQYGGVSDRSDCDSMPAALQSGCYWRFDWFNNADNPKHSFTQIRCPDELVSISGCRRTDDSSFPKYTMSTTTWSAPIPTETASAWGQCDSVTWDIAKQCPSGYYCSEINQYYFQCVQGTSSKAQTSSTTSSRSTSTKVSSTSTASQLTSSSKATSTISSSTTAQTSTQAAMAVDAVKTTNPSKVSSSSSKSTSSPMKVTSSSSKVSSSSSKSTSTTVKGTSTSRLSSTSSKSSSSTVKSTSSSSKVSSSSSRSTSTTVKGTSSSTTKSTSSTSTTKK